MNEQFFWGAATSSHQVEGENLNDWTEWARLEPEDGRFNKQEMQHYRKVVLALRERGLEPFVTLWHFTLPVWLAKKGGVLNKNFPEYLARYSGYVVKNLKADVRFWITINEPTAIVFNSYFRGVWPPQKRGLINGLRAFFRLAKTHKQALRAIREAEAKAMVGFANDMLDIEPAGGGILDKLAAFIWDCASNRFFNFLVGKKISAIISPCNIFSTSK